MTGNDRNEIKSYDCFFPNIDPIFKRRDQSVEKKIRHSHLVNVFIPSNNLDVGILL